MLMRGHLPESAGVPSPTEGERLERVAEVANVVIEHIVSPASDTAVDYDQAQDEWVLVLSGRATLDIDGEHCELTAGDWVLLPSRVPHTLARTDAGTRWLAVHVHPPA